MLRIASDENFRGDLLQILAGRQPALDLVRILDVGLGGMADTDLLAWCADHHRVLLTHDRTTMPGFDYARVRRGQPMSGVIIIPTHAPATATADSLQIAIECSDPSELEGEVWFLGVTPRRG